MALTTNFSILDNASRKHEIRAHRLDLRGEEMSRHGKITFVDALDGPDAPISVHYALPPHIHAKSPIAIILPGIKRRAKPYLRAWAPYAARAGAILLIPKLPQTTYPGAHGYNMGNMHDRHRRSISRSRWAFALIERLFDHIRVKTKNTRDGYAIYGHSAGAQLVHRMRLFFPEARIERAVAANAGWYTLPSFAEKCPYGLGGTGMSGPAMRRVLERPMDVLVGQRDQDTAHQSLRRAAGAMRQGRNRVERGQTFFAAAQAAAAAHGANLAWHLTLVPGAGHCQSEMAEAAAASLFSEGGGELPRDHPRE